MKETVDAGKMVSRKWHSPPPCSNSGSPATAEQRVAHGTSLILTVQFKPLAVSQMVRQFCGRGEAEAEIRSGGRRCQMQESGELQPLLFGRRMMVIALSTAWSPASS